MVAQTSLHADATDGPSQRARPIRGGDRARKAPIGVRIMSHNPRSSEVPRPATLAYPPTAALGAGTLRLGAETRAEACLGGSPATESQGLNGPSSVSGLNRVGHAVLSPLSSPEELLRPRRFVTTALCSPDGPKRPEHVVVSWPNSGSYSRRLKTPPRAGASGINREAGLASFLLTVLAGAL